MNFSVVNVKTNLYSAIKTQASKSFVAAVIQENKPTFLTQCICRGTGVGGLTRGLAILHQGNQEPLVVMDKLGIPTGELEASKSVTCDIFPFSVGRVTERASGLQTLDVGLLVVTI